MLTCWAFCLGTSDGCVSSCDGDAGAVVSHILFRLFVMLRFWMIAEAVSSSFTSVYGFKSVKLLFFSIDVYVSAVSSVSSLVFVGLMYQNGNNNNP